MNTSAQLRARQDLKQFKKLAAAMLVGSLQIIEGGKDKGEFSASKELNWSKSEKCKCICSLAGVPWQKFRDAALRMAGKLADMPKTKMRRSPLQHKGRPNPGAKKYCWNMELLTLHEIAKRTGMNRTCLRYRIEVKKMSVKDAINKPTGREI